MRCPASRGVAASKYAFVEDNDDGLYILTKSGVMIRQVVGLGSRDM